MNIRLEQPQDWSKVENLTREAFWNVYRPGCTEHYVLNQYRSNPDFIPELDFVMEEDGKIIGHVMFSKAEIILDDGNHFPSWTFGPISIHPDYKRKGYGLKLLNYALEKAKGMGIGLLSMEGNIDFYKHAGFDLASKLKIHYHAEPRDAEVPYFLAQELISGYWGNREGVYCPPEGYFVADKNPEAFEAYEATFPKKEKTLQPSQLPQFCQSCGMPLTKNEDCGTNADGSMKTLIIYGSQYGSTKRYAEHLSETTGIEAVDYKQVKDLEGYDRIIFMGGLYAGGVLGLKKTVGKMTDNQELIIVTVGVTDPSETEYFCEIRKSIKAKIPANLYNEEKIFHLRGAIDYSQLDMKHRFMMSMFHKMVLKTPESQRTADAKAMLETYGQHVDFVDFNALEKITSQLL